MLAPASLSRPLCSCRLLSLAGARALANAVRLPRYTAILDALRGLGEHGQIASLWRAVLPPEAGDPPVEQGTLDLAYEFAGNVDHFLFPLDLAAMDDLVNGGEEDVFDCPIYLGSAGVPWELAGIGEVPCPVQPVLATIAPQFFYGQDEAYVAGDDEEAEQDEDGLPLVARVDLFGYLEAMPEARQDISAIVGDSRRWWKDNYNREPPRWGLPPGKEGVVRLQEALRLQPPPLDALADVIDCILKDTGSIWLDQVSGFWAMEYEIEYGADLHAWYWDPGDIRQLAGLFDRVRPAFQRLDAYSDWYSDTYGRPYPARAQQVADLLCRLAAGDWHIEEGGTIVYHD